MIVEKKNLNSIEIFISYAPEDEEIREQLVKHLASLNRQGLANTWYNRKIEPGFHKQVEINQHINSAQIILLLVSPDFIASDYCYSTEMQRAIERHQRADAYVVPVLLRPVYWQDTPLVQFSMLPTGEKPVSTYDDLDLTLLDVVMGIARIAKENIRHDIDTSSANFPHRPIPITSIAAPSRFGNEGVASFLLNEQEYILHYKRIDGIRKFLDQRNLGSLRYQTIRLSYYQQGKEMVLVEEEVSELAPLRTIVKQHTFQIEGVDCLFTFKMLAITGIMSARLVVGEVEIFSF